MADIDDVISKVRQKKLMIATPMGRDPKRCYHKAMIELEGYFHKAGLDYQMQTIEGCSDLAYARNLIAAEFLQSDCTDLIWIDDDINFSPYSVMALLMSDRDFIGAAYRKKIVKQDADPVGWCVYLEDNAPVRDENGAVRIRAIGFGFLKTSRKVYETIIATNPAVTPRERTAICKEEPEKFYGFFRFDGVTTSEDFIFCDMWRAAGGDVWLNPNITLGHVGDYEYRGDVEALVAAHTDYFNRQAAE